MSRQANPIPSPQAPQGGVTHHRDRIFDDPQHDPYHAKGKYHEPTVCDVCGLVFHHGHWQRTAAPEGAHKVACPACRRIHDRLPAGFLTLEGGFFENHRDEVLALVRDVADRDGNEHPLNRIIGIAVGPASTTVTTTDIHLPQRIGAALTSTFQGTLDVQYGHQEYSVRVHWRR
jgi:hypothetical protein